MVGKSKKQIFEVLRDRIWKRINGWGEKMLSTAGKEVLIKAVLQSIPTYIMSCFFLPGYLIDSIEAAIRDFWWRRRNEWLGWHASNCVGPRKKAAWDSATCELLIWHC